MKTYVVIPQFLVNDELVELADNAIKSFKDSSVAFIISVDDAGEYEKGKGSDEVLAKSDLILTNEKNSGFAITCNNGFRWIFENEKDDCYIICANNDIKINKKVIPALIEPFDKYDNVAITGIISFMSEYPEGQPIEEFSWGAMSEGGQLRDRMQDGGLWCSKKSILEKIGIFDENFIRGGYEDIDLFLRAKDTFGMKIVMSGMAGYWHKQGATRWNSEKVGAINNFGDHCRSVESKNLKYFIQKWGYNPHTKSIWEEKQLFNA